MYDPNDTICAIATAPGGAARGMVRVSGPNAIPIVDGLFRADDGRSLDKVRYAIEVSGHISAGEHQLPCDLFLWPTSRSYTRQPVAELHTIGSRPLLDALLTTLCRAGARLAESGEFTLRAFLAGRLDLTQAEAVLGVIDAQSNEELGTALSQLAGGLARPLHQLRDDLLQLLAELDAGLDFVDEDIEFISREVLSKRLASAQQLLGEAAQQICSRSTSTDLAQVVLVGPPNVGKSSLFNALIEKSDADGQAGRRAARPALVSPQRGTTRDYLTATINLRGIRCELIDTAGVDEKISHAMEPSPLDQQADVDASAQTLAARRRNEATIRICCMEAGADSQRAIEIDSSCDIVALTKSDLHSPSPPPYDRLEHRAPVIVTSSRTGEGLDELRAASRRMLTTDAMAVRTLVVGVTAERCRESIRLAEEAIRHAIEVAAALGGDELVSADLRTALSELGKVVGAVYTEELLDRIFSSFCIGK